MKYRGSAEPGEAHLICIEDDASGAGEMAVWLRVLAAFTDNLGSVSMRPHGSSQLQFQDTQHLFWPPCAPSTPVVHTRKAAMQMK